MDLASAGAVAAAFAVTDADAAAIVLDAWLLLEILAAIKWFSSARTPTPTHTQTNTGTANTRTLIGTKCNHPLLWLPFNGANCAASVPSAATSLQP